LILLRILIPGMLGIGTMVPIRLPGHEPRERDDRAAQQGQVVVDPVQLRPEPLLVAGGHGLLPSAHGHRTGM
jgi:hypothetical protein